MEPKGAKIEAKEGTGAENEAIANHWFLEPLEVRVEPMLGTRCVFFGSGVWTEAQGGLMERTLERKEGTWSSFSAISFFQRARAPLKKFDTI